MAREDLEAGKAYVAKNWKNFSTIQKLHFLRNNSTDEVLKARLNAAFAEARTEAQQQMLIEAEWHERFIAPHLAKIEGGNCDPPEENDKTIKASQLDRDRVDFLKMLKAKDRRITQKEAAEKWAKLHNDQCDEQGIRNAVYRVKHHGKKVGKRNKS